MIVGDTHIRAGAFVATDTRVRYLDGSCDDPGGKIVRTPAGWATGSGGFKQVMAVLAALRDAGEQTGVDRTKRATEVATAAITAAGLELRGWKEEDEIFGSSWMSRGAVILIEPRQEIVLLRNGDSEVVFHAGAGPGDFVGWEERYVEMRADIEGAQHDLGGRIRAAAKHFAIVSRASRLMSGVMEVGWICPTFLGPFHGFLRGEAEEIANTEGCDILKRFRADPPTALPPSSRCSTRSTSVVVDVPPNRITGGGATPSLSVLDSYWNGANTIVGTDTAGMITLNKTTTSSSQHNGHQVQVTFAAPYAAPPFVLFNSDLDGAFGLILGAISATDFYIDCNTTIPRAGTVAAVGHITYGVIG
jgi:hypothetical protein